MKLFSGSSNVPLAEKVAHNLGLTLSPARITRFSNSETKVQILENVKDQDCVVIQSTSNPTDTHVLELLFFCDALRRQEAHKVVGVMPYFGYARQDIQHEEGESVSANVIIRFLEAIGFGKVYTIDLHNEATEGVFSIPFKNLSAMELLAKKALLHFSSKKIDKNMISVVVPDQGAIEQGRRFGEVFFGGNDFPLAVIEKKRSGESTQSFGLYGDVNGTHIVIVDDMIVTGSTLMSAVEFMKKKYKITSFTIVATHHDFAKDAHIKLQQSAIDTLITSDSILLDPAVKMSKLQEVSLAPLIADQLRDLIE